MTRRKLFRPISLITLGMVLGVTGCGTVQATSQTQVRGGEPSGSAPIDAALVTPGFGWVLTVDRFLVTRDGGVTFRNAKAPVPVTTARAAFFRDAQNGYVTASTGNTITTAHTSDGGRTWQTGTVRDAAAPAAEYGRLRMTFGDADHGVIVAQTSASAMSSSATLFATEDGGASWSARSAPTAGEVVMEPDGRTWLAGGVVGDALHFSTDQGRHWSSATLHVDGAVDSEAVAPPIDGVVPVTVVTKTDQTEVALLTSADMGRTWRETNRVAVRGRTGPDVRVPVAVTGAGPLVLDPAGGHAYRVPVRRSAATTAAAPDLRPAGLSEGADTLTFASDRRTGWALGAYGRCANGKSNCTLYHPLLATTDGGGTWRQVQLWQQKLN